jgi:phosphoglycerate kinase
MEARLTSETRMTPLEAFDYRGRTVLLRLDVNAPIDPATKRIRNDNRFRKSLPTLRYLLDAGARVAILAHQGDTLDYQNLIPMAEHAERLAALAGTPIPYVDDVCGPAAVAAVKALQDGGAVFLGNLRYLTEEVSGFEKEVKLTADQMLDTWLVRSLAPLADFYVNDAFSAAHRNSPSMVAFQRLLPTAGGRQLYAEYDALSKVLAGAAKPAVFVLGGAKISDAFGMMDQVLRNGTADRILACGITGQIFLLAKGLKLGAATDRFLADKDLTVFVEQARVMLAAYPDKFETPTDLAYAVDGKRTVVGLDALPIETALFLDIGPDTCARFDTVLATAGTIFANGPAGVYENPEFEAGTRAVLESIARSPGYSVIGGGDTVSAAAKYVDDARFGYICTAGGAMVRFLAGRPLPLIEAMEAAYERDCQKGRDL